jgi:hypothetical protein
MTMAAATFVLISHFHHLVAEKMYSHHKNLVAGQHVEIFGRFGYIFYLRHITKNRSMSHGSVVTFDTVCLILLSLVFCLLKLYSYLEQLGLRALYADTYSVVYTSRPGDWKPELGDYLGDLTDEVPDNRIIEFVIGGPKNYAYKIARPDSSTNSSLY